MPRLQFHHVVRSGFFQASAAYANLARHGLRWQMPRDKVHLRKAMLLGDTSTMKTSHCSNAAKTA